MPRTITIPSVIQISDIKSLTIIPRTNLAQVTVMQLDGDREVSSTTTDLSLAEVARALEISEAQLRAGLWRCAGVTPSEAAQIVNADLVAIEARAVEVATIPELTTTPEK